jgi:GYF domain 2
MSNRSWFFASQGQQQGPYPEARLHEFIAAGTITAETLVWTEGMAGWQKAAEIPGLIAGISGPPAVPQSGGPLLSAGGLGGGPLSIELGLWSYFGRSLLFVIGLLLVIPGPWTATGFYRWIASRVRVPGRPNFGFTGKVGDIWYVFVAIGLMSYAGLTGISYLPSILIPVQAFLSWMTVRWIAANLSSNGERLPIEFKGSALGYVGWYLLMTISAITIIGWAWIITAWMRWICRNVSGTRREIVFNATGWEVLWRTLLFAVGCAFLIPIPWVMRWYTAWYVSQFALVGRTAHASA